MAKRPLPEAASLEGKPYLKPREAAAVLGCSPSKIIKWRDAGILPKQSEWTREQLLAAAKARAEAPPKKRGKGLKLELGNPVPSKPTKEGGESKSGVAPVAPSSPPSPSKKESPKKAGFFDRALRALDLTEDDQDDDEE